MALLLGQVLTQMQLRGHLDLHVHDWVRQKLLKRHIRPSLTGAPAAAGGLCSAPAGLSPANDGGLRGPGLAEVQQGCLSALRVLGKPCVFFGE